MFAMVADSFGWMPLVIRLPLLGFLSVLALIAVVKLVTVVLSLISTVMQIIIPWK